MEKQDNAHRRNKVECFNVWPIFSEDAKNVENNPRVL